MNYKKILGALTILGMLAAGGTAFAQTSSTTGTGTTGTSGNTTTTGTAGAATTNTTSGTGATTGTSATTPTAPNTGAGGDAAENYALLGGSALIVAAGVAYVSRKKALV